MGRYTSVQTFTDQSTKVIQTSSSSNSSSSSSNATGISVGTSNNNVKISKTLDTVDNVSGSTAGAGSNEFHLYNNARSREMLRVEVMNDELRDNAEKKEFNDKVEKNKREAQEKTRKNAERRRKRKKLREQNSNSSNDNNNNSYNNKDNNDDEHNKARKISE